MLFRLSLRITTMSDRVLLSRPREHFIESSFMVRFEEKFATSLEYDYGISQKYKILTGALKSGTSKNSYYEFRIRLPHLELIVNCGIVKSVKST